MADDCFRTLLAILHSLQNFRPSLQGPEFETYSRTPLVTAAQTNKDKASYNETSGQGFRQQLPSLKMFFEPGRTKFCQEKRSDEDDDVPHARNGVHNGWMAKADRIEDEKRSYSCNESIDEVPEPILRIVLCRFGEDLTSP